MDQSKHSNIVKQILVILISANIYQSSTSQNAHQHQLAKTTAGLKAYRNQQGDIVAEPNTARTHQSISRQKNINESTPVMIVRNPNPDGGWMMVLDGQIQAQQHAVRKGGAHCQIKNLTAYDHRALKNPSNPNQSNANQSINSSFVMDHSN